jgi:RNA polymerase sigma factor (TIGR02999 family)
MMSAHPEGPAEITKILESWSNGDPTALDRVVSEIYLELRRLADAQLRRQRSNGTLNAPALVNEAYLRLREVKPFLCKNRSSFFALASTVMKRICCDYVRARAARKRGNGAGTVTLSDVAADVGIRDDTDLLAVEAALNELFEIDVRQGRIIEMRFFGGLSIDETAEALKISPATVKRQSTMAQSWMKRRLSRSRHGYYVDEQNRR